MAGTSVIFPFSIEGGSVAVTHSDEHAAKSKMLFLLGSATGERAMRSTWGVNLLSTSHMIGADLQVAVPEAIRSALGKWLPGIRLIDSTVVEHPDDPTYLQVEVRFARSGSNQDSTLQLDMSVPEGGS